MNEEIQTTEQSNNLSIPEVKIDKKILFHGSTSSNIEQFHKAEETTIGQGLYLTSDPVSAEGYAKRRSTGRKESNPAVYEVEIENMRLADLRTLEGIKPLADLMLVKLTELSKDPNLNWLQENVVVETISKIREDKYRSLKDLVWNHQDVITNLLKDQGFDGVLAEEGGEGEEIGEHDSYVIFNPEKVVIKSMQKVA